LIRGQSDTPEAAQAGGACHLWVALDRETTSNFQRDEQAALCAFITPPSNALPQEASFQAALAAFAIIWMFEKHHQHRVPKVTNAEIQRCLDNNGYSLSAVAH
jgi:hypothetical protein